MNVEKWTKETYEAFRQELFVQAEEGYREFHAKLLCSELPVIGLRVPFLRKTAKAVVKEDGGGFLQVCGQDTYEERLLYGLVAAALPVPYEEFLPLCDHYTEKLAENWAHCDVFSFSVKGIIRGHEEEFFVYIEKYLQSENPWAVRMGLVLMLSNYLTEEYMDAVLERTDNVRSEHYYVRMAQAWLLATAWAKDRERMLEYIARHHLDDWTFHKFVQKCCESFRISDADKIMLRNMEKRNPL